MRRALLLSLFLLTLGGCRSLVQAVKNQPCAADPAYRVMTVDPATDEIRLYGRDAAGKPFRTIAAVQRLVEAEGDSLIAATNAGIYEPGLVPTGLSVEDGVVRTPLNTATGEGNFFLTPNGVFFVRPDGSAAVLETEAFAAHYVGAAGDTLSGVRYATQSGPLLVETSAVHPAFRPQSDNCRRRSGVGVTPDGRVVFALAEAPVRFYDFAVFFRDTLGAPDALYLDGGGEARQWTPDRPDDGTFAGILAVVRPSKQQ